MTINTDNEFRRQTMSNPYESGQHVYIKDPSGRLGSSGITEFHLLAPIIDIYFSGILQ